MEQVVIQFSADISKLLPAIEAFEQVGLLEKKNGDIFRATSAEYAKRNQVIDQTIAKNKELDKTISTGAVEQHTQDIKENTAAIEKNNDEQENLIRQLKLMQRELIAMEAAGQQNTQKFKDMQRAAGELRDTISDAKERIKTFASDTRRLDAVVQSFKLVAAGAAAMQGAMAMFGAESQEMQKTMMKLQGAMALLAGVQEIANFATGQSALKLILVDNAQKLVAASATAMGVSIGTATAIMTGGISVIFGAIAAYLLLNDTEEDNTDIIKLNTEARKAQKEAIRDLQQQIAGAKVAFMKESGAYDDFDAQMVERMNKQQKDLEDAELKRGKTIKEITDKTIDQMFKSDKHRNEARGELEVIGGKLRLKAVAEAGDKMIDLINKVNKSALSSEQGYLDEVKLINQLAETDFQNIEKSKANFEKAEREKAADKRKQESEKKKAEAKKEADELYQIQLKNMQMQLELDKAFKTSKEKQLQIQKDWGRSAEEIDALYFELYQTGLYETSDAIYTEIEKRLKANADYYNKLIAEDKAANDQLEKNKKAQTDIETKYKKTQAEIDERYNQIILTGRAKTSDEAFAILKQELDEEEKAAKKKEEIRKQSLQLAIQTTQQLADFVIESRQAEIDALFEKNIAALDAEKAAVLENQNLTETQKLATEEYFESRRKKLQLQQWKETQRLNIQAAIINTALAITSALAAGPYPAAFFTAAGAGIAGAIQIAKIRSTPPPQFAEGVEFLEGAGDGTSDSIPALLSRGERVVPARTNKDYFDGLSVIQNRLVAPELVNTLLTNLAENGGMLAAPAEAITQIEQEFGIDYARLGREFQKGRTQVSINIDEKGFTKHIQQGLNRSTYHNQKFRFKQ